MRWHAATGPWGELRKISDEELEVDDVPFETARELCGLRAESPAILNDIMWSGDRVRRPDSTTDFEARFSLSSTPTCFDQPISHTFVEPEELFSFSSLSHCSDQDLDMLDRLANGEAAFDIPSEDLSSETEEDEIDVVSVTVDKTEEKAAATTCQSSDTTGQEDRPMNTPARQRWSRRKNQESSELGNEDGNGRISHNDLERKRRNDLRNRFQCLRKSIPSLQESERAAKITILRRAAELIPLLQKEEEKLLALKGEEKKRNAALLNTLMKLTKKQEKMNATFVQFQE